MSPLVKSSLAEQDEEIDSPQPTTSNSNNKNELVITSQERVVLLIDNSGSMAGPFSTGQLKSSQHAAYEATLAILQCSAPNITAYGIVAFNTLPLVVQQITTNYLLLYKNASLRSDGGTAMNLGISCALQQNPSRIILLSDGAPTCNMEDICSIIQTAITLSTKIDTISIGGASDTIMQEIARRTAGKWQRPISPAELVQSFQKLETRNRLLLE